MAETNPTLSQAYELIEAEKLDEARQLLQPMVTREPNNVDAWWLYAHSVTDASTARTALQNVLRLDPNYTGARDLLSTLDERFPATAPVAPPTLPSAPTQPVQQPQPADPVPDFLDDNEFLFGDNDLSPAPVASSTTTTTTDDDDIDFDFDALDQTDDDLDPSLDDDEDDALEGDQAQRRLPLPLMIGGVILAVLLLVGLLALVLSMLLNQPTPTGDGTQVADNPTPTVDLGVGVAPSLEPELTAVVEETPDEAVIQPTEETTNAEPTEDSANGEATETVLPLEATPTRESVLPVATDDLGAGGGGATTDSEAILARMSSFELADESTDSLTSELGETLIVRICSTPPRLQTLAAEAMPALAQTSPSVGEDYQALGVAFINCDTDTTLRIVGVSLDDALDFANGNTNNAEFQQAWRPLG